MPAYGISEEEVQKVREALRAEAGDAVVFVADSTENSEDALKAVVERAREAVNGVPSETRTAKADGTTRYMRPRPGAARMYPETDIPPELITDALIEKVRSSLPEPSEKKLARFQKDYRLNEKLAKQIIDSEYSRLFERIINESSVSPTTVSAFLTETLKALKRTGIQVENVDDEEIFNIFKAIGEGQLAKEAAEDVFDWLSKHEDKSLLDATAELNLKMLSRPELEELINRAINSNKNSINKKGLNAFGMLMGMVMKEARGRADPEVVNRLLKEHLQTYLSAK
jgi:glutamyl-tRNA(Gln) amidotransferase subunit E